MDEARGDDVRASREPGERDRLTILLAELAYAAADARDDFIAYIARLGLAHLAEGDANGPNTTATRRT